MEGEVCSNVKTKGRGHKELRANGLGVFLFDTQKNSAKLIPKLLWEARVQKTVVKKH